MKMYPFLMVLLVLVFAVTACTTVVAQSRAVQLPDSLTVVLGSFVLVAFTGLAKWISAKIGIDIKDQSGQIAAAVSAVLVLLINYGLGLVPAAYDNLLSGFFAFLTVFFGGVGAFSVFFRVKRWNA